MRTGPPKTPTNIAEARGNPGRRPLNTDEPKPALADAVPPEDLDGAALGIWLARVPALVACNLIALVDVGHVARACRLEALADELWRAGHGNAVGESRLKEPRETQEITTALRLYDAADRIWYRLGITPSERTHLRGQGPSEPKDRLGEHLRQRPKAPRAVTA